jgi:hypothetical protein
VFLYDISLANVPPEVFFDLDYTCPYLCAEHMAENEAGAFNRFTQEDLARQVLDLQDILAQGAPTAAERLAGARAGQIDRPRRREEEPRAVIASEILDDLRTQPDFHLPAVREPRGVIYYPFSNRNRAQGFTIYRSLEGRHE